jgi:hypothetical protein
VVRAEAAFHFLDREGKEEGDRERPVKDGRCVGRLPADPEEAPRFLFEVWGAVDGDGRPAGIGHALFGPYPTAPGDLEVTLPAGRTLEGRVVDADGSGVPGISVSAEDAEEICDGDFSATTEAGGRFRIEGVGDREYRVSVCPPRWAQPMPAPLVARGGAADLLLALRAGEAFRVRVLDPDGRALAGARVTARVDGEIRDGWRMTTNALGVARLAGFAPGATGDLQVEPPDGRDDLLPLENEAWRPADGDVRLARGYVLEVRVQDGQGRPVPEAWVIHSLEDGDGSWTWEETSEEGTLRLVRLPPGRIRLRARLQESKEEADGEGYPTTTASTGAGKVALVLDPGGEVRLRLKDGHGVQAWVTAAIPGETEPSIGLRFRGTEEGRFRGVPAGKTCDLYVVDSKQRCAVLRGVAPGGGVLEVPLAPGREIEGRCLLPAEGVRRRRIALLVGDAALIGSERFQEDGSFRFRSVPEGRWKVRVVLTLSRSEGGTTEKVVLAEAEPGQPLEIDAR